MGRFFLTFALAMGVHAHATSPTSAGYAFIERTFGCYELRPMAVGQSSATTLWETTIADWKSRGTVRNMLDGSAVDFQLSSMGALSQIIVLERPQGLAPTVLTNNMAGRAFALVANATQNDVTPYIHPEITYLEQVSRTQALALDMRSNLLVITAEGHAHRVMDNTWRSQLGFNSRPVVFAALHVESLSPLKGRFVFAEHSGQIAVADLDASKKGGEQCTVVHSDLTGTGIWPTQIVASKTHFFVLGMENGYTASANAVLLAYSRDLARRANIDWGHSTLSKTGIRGMSHYSTQLTEHLTAEVLGINERRDTLAIRNADMIRYYSVYGFDRIDAEIIHLRRATYGHSTLSTDTAFITPSSSLPESIADKAQAVPRVVDPVWGPIGTWMLNALSNRSRWVVGDPVPVDRAQWAELLASERQRKHYSSSSFPNIHVDGNPTMREFVAYTNQSDFLRPLLFHYFGGIHRLSYGFFWEEPGIRARSPFTVDTDRVPLGEILDILSRRANTSTPCEAALTPRR